MHDLYYWHGNEPNIHAAYLFDFVGRPELTAQWVRWAMREKYANDPGGLDGNDDGGTLSAWYVFSALGFYPVNPCSEYYMIGSPIFERAHVRVGDGAILTVTAENASWENIYVQSVALNGEPLEVSWFRYDDIADGGTLAFVMGPEPSDWGRAKFPSER
ncbi:MAG: glycoside hydrolase family 92 protein [Deltaproteobacteria bacterium]|nr:glycoside hydrolase family 92 protein [Deltaproteobacteria bacterium]